MPNVIEFVKNSPELKEFIDSTKSHNRHDEEYDGDSTSYTDIRVNKDGKYYSVPMTVSDGMYSTPEISFHHRNYKSSEPYVVMVHEVKPYEYKVIGWENV